MSDGQLAHKDAPNAWSSAAVLVAHGAFLAACGCYGAASKNWAPEVMHSAHAGIGAGTALVVCAILAVIGVRKLYMIGVHVALLLQVVFIGVFTLQAYKSYGNPAKADRFPLFVVMALGSVAGLAGMYLCKPKKEKKQD